MTRVDQLEETDYQDFVAAKAKKAAKYYAMPMDQVAYKFRKWFNEEHSDPLDELDDETLRIVMNSLRGRFRGEEDNLGPGKPDEARKSSASSVSGRYGSHKHNWDE